MTSLIALASAALAGLPWLCGRARPAPPRPPRPVDIAVILDLAAAGMAAGAAVPAIVEGIGRAVGDDELGIVATAVRLGVAWDVAWGQASARYGPLADALAPAWLDGVGPAPLLAAAATRVRARRHRQAREAAERLAVRLVVPLGLCQLPAFVLLGLVPVVLGLLSR